MMVIEELDRFKSFNDERGRSARLISRRLTVCVQRKDIGRRPSEKWRHVKDRAQPRDPIASGLRNVKADHSILGIAAFLQQKGTRLS